ncbi:MAG: magnesium chelatase subunit H [Pseudomonadota bacterium]
MKRKPTTVAEAATVKVVLVTLDNHLCRVVEQVQAKLAKQLPGMVLSVHAASNWQANPKELEQCRADIEAGDIIVVTMLFMEEHIEAVLPNLRARRDECDAMVCCMAASEVMQLTRMGRFSMNGEQSGPMALLKRFRGSSGGSRKSAGAQQLSVLRRLPRILRFIPGTAQDVRAYFLTLQYWLAGSEENLRNMVLFLADRYGQGERAGACASIKIGAPIDYPEVGVYHPAVPQRIFEAERELPGHGRRSQGRVGLLLMRSYALAGNASHYDAVIEQLEARGLRVIPAFASGLDARPAIERYFLSKGKPVVDAVLSLTGFSLVGGPAYNDASAAEQMLAELDVPYIAAQALEFQSLESWQASPHGLMPIEATMMVAIPELDGAIAPSVFGGRSETSADASPAREEGTHDMRPEPERVVSLADRVAKLVALRREGRDTRRVAIVLFNFPPNAGNTGTAAHLNVFESLFETLLELSRQGYDIDVPDSVEALRKAIIGGNAERYGTHANVLERISVDDHVTREPWLDDIEAQWGAAPGKQLSDGGGLFILGARFGNVMVGVQPGMGYEGDPMRLLFEGGFAPTHAFSAFYRYLREDFKANAVVHFGTHGALEFMPGKQVGLSRDCWPERLIGDLPNFYLYAANNPSEGLIAKRRSAATLISYLTPALANCELYQGLQALRESIDRWRGQPQQGEAARDLAELVQAQASAVDLCAAEPPWEVRDYEKRVTALHAQLMELQDTLVPYGLHVLGREMPRAQRLDMLAAMGRAALDVELPRGCVEALVDGCSVREALPLVGNTGLDEDTLATKLGELAEAGMLLSRNDEIGALVHALDGGFVRPVPGGDLLQNPAILPTGRNLHGFDPYRLPDAFCLKEGERQAQRLLERHAEEGAPPPESVALVLWGTDNLKTGGTPIAQALALLGAQPRHDGYGRLTGARLIPLAQLGRPRIDVIITMSGIFRDLLPLQARLLAEAAYLAAEADEPLQHNFVRKHALAYMDEHDCDLETAALRVFSNAEGAYGANVNMLVDNGQWDDEDELAEAYTRRKGFAYKRSGESVARSAQLQEMLGDVDLAYQNLDSVELGVTTVDHYFDTLGGISRAIKRESGRDVSVYISDQTLGDGKIRTLQEQVALETRTRVLNPKWYESMLDSGFEGVRHIEEHVTNTLGWSATTGSVSPWVYQRISETFILDEAMRKRLAELNPTAAAKVANRLMEAQERDYWAPDDECLDALRRAGEDLEDWLEGVSSEAAA